MQDLTSQISSNTTQIKLFDNIKIESYGEEVTSNMFNKYIPSGITLKLNLPLVAKTGTFLFAINTDGFIPYHSMAQNKNKLASQNWMQNLFPVQTSQELAAATPEILEINYRPTAQPSLLPYWSSRCISGNVGIGLRLSSNTSQTGNLFFSHKSGLVRKYQKVELGGAYEGLKFENDASTVGTTFSKSFSIVDVSLQRHISIATNSTKTLPFTDLPLKLMKVDGKQVIPPELGEMYREDWIFVGINSDLPASDTNQLNIEVLFDYSTVQFSMPMLYLHNNPAVINLKMNSYYKPAPKEYHHQEEYEEAKQKLMMRVKTIEE